MNIQFKTLEDKITTRLDDMITRAGSGLQAYLNRVVYSQYQQFQIERWDSENASEGGRWKPLQAEYQKYKARKFAGYPYRGQKILVATGTLLQSVVGGDLQYHRKIATQAGITIQTTLPYAPYVAEQRPFMEFGSDSMRIMKQGIVDFISKGRE